MCVLDTNLYHKTGRCCFFSLRCLLLMIYSIKRIEFKKFICKDRWIHNVFKRSCGEKKYSRILNQRNMSSKILKIPSNFTHLIMINMRNRSKIALIPNLSGTNYFCGFCLTARKQQEYYKNTSMRVYLQGKKIET